jgi:hypothetical protein
LEQIEPLNWTFFTLKKNILFVMYNKCVGQNEIKGVTSISLH